MEMQATHLKAVELLVLEHYSLNPPIIAKWSCWWFGTNLTYNRIAACDNHDCTVVVANNWVIVWFRKAVGHSSLSLAHFRHQCLHWSGGRFDLNGENSNKNPSTRPSCALKLSFLSSMDPKHRFVGSFQFCLMAATAKEKKQKVNFAW